MGFLEGVAYKLLGNVCVWRQGRAMEEWTYWTDGICRHRGTFFERKIDFRRDVLRFDPVAQDEIGDRLAEAKLKLAGHVLSKEHYAAIVGLLTLPMLVSIPIVLARSKAIDSKNEALKQDALRKLNEQPLVCLDITLRDLATVLLVSPPDIGAKIVQDIRSTSD